MNTWMFPFLPIGFYRIAKDSYDGITFSGAFARGFRRDGHGPQIGPPLASLRTPARGRPKATARGRAAPSIAQATGPDSDRRAHAEKCLASPNTSCDPPALRRGPRFGFLTKRRRPATLVSWTKRRRPATLASWTKR